MSETLISKGLDLNTQNNVGQSPLHVAVAVRNEDGAGMLLRLSANPNICDIYGRTPLHAAFIVSAPPISLLRLLFRWNALPDTVDIEGVSCFNTAYNTQDPEIISLFKVALLKKSHVASTPSRLSP